jgi:hypothetical protein
MRLTPLRAIWALVLSSALLSPAKIEDWKDPQGNVFKAEPAEALGPFALFRTPTGGGRRLPWRALSHADCARFEAQAGTKPPPAERWDDAHGELTGRLRGQLRQFVGSNLVNADLAARAEPELLIVFFVDAAQGSSWDMLNKAIAPFNILQEKNPAEIAGVQYGMHQGGPDLYNGLALQANLPWMLINYSEQPRLTTLARLAPGRGDCALYVLSRDGVPITAVTNPDEAAINQFFTDVEALLGLLRPANPHSWADRAHYLAGLQLARHQQDSTGPVLVGNPLVARTLRNLHERGIARVEAKIDVGADGKATAVTLKEDPAISAKLASDLAKALQQFSVFAPAVDKGQFVAGTYQYSIEVKP